jgi:Ca2+-binding RTX toxin-like protein
MALAAKIWNGNSLANIIFGTRHTGSYEVLDGKGGNDQLYGGGGPDFILGGTGNDVLDGGNNFGTSTTFPGNTYIPNVGRGFNDTYADRLYGGPGNDVLHGGPRSYMNGDGVADGNPPLQIDRGDDFFVFHDAGGQDWLKLGAGYSHVSQFDWSAKHRDKIKMVGGEDAYDVVKVSAHLTSQDKDGKGGVYHLDDFWIRGDHGERVRITPENNGHGTDVYFHNNSGTTAEALTDIQTLTDPWFI